MTYETVTHFAMRPSDAYDPAALRVWLDRYPLPPVPTGDGGLPAVDEAIGIREAIRDLRQLFALTDEEYADQRRTFASATDISLLVANNGIRAYLHREIADWSDRARSPEQWSTGYFDKGRQSVFEAVLAWLKV